jgi:hypothetical protein
MDSTIQSFNMKGTKNYTISMPAPIVSIVKMDSGRGDS